MPMREADLRLVDEAVGMAIEALPEHLSQLIEEVPIVLIDHPTPEMLTDLGIDLADENALDEICGLHTGIPITEDSVEHSAELPTVIHLFRRGLLGMAMDEAGRIDRETLDREVRITILHELGHHFGLEEQDLDDLGYG